MQEGRKSPTIADQGSGERLLLGTVHIFYLTTLYYGCFVLALTVFAFKGEPTSNTSRECLRVFIRLDSLKTLRGYLHLLEKITTFFPKGPFLRFLLIPAPMVQV